MAVKVSGGKLILANGETVALGLPVRDFLETDGVIVVVLDSNDDERNVYGVDQRGNILWRIQRRGFPDGPCTPEGWPRQDEGRVRNGPPPSLLSRHDGFVRRSSALRSFLC